jgi:tetratricopeptide (TPR) repeat protein
MTHKIVAVLFVLTLTSTAQAQKVSPAPKSSLCTRENSLDMINQQILTSRTFDNQIRRIAVLIRSADLLWPYQKEKALAAFNEAFELATQNFKENGDVVGRTSSSSFAARIPQPDQRYKVITALAKRDATAARKLSEQAMQSDLEAVEQNGSQNAEVKKKLAEKLLTVAFALLETDPMAAANFARNSFQYTATLNLPGFLYSLAKVNRGLADALYGDALVTYGNAPMDQFLYLSSYPFGNNREAGEMPGYTFYQVPEGFVPNVALERAFAQKLLARTQVALEAPEETVTNSRWTELSQAWMALTRLEKQISSSLPDLAESATQAKDRAFASFSQANQKKTNNVISSENEPKKSFDEKVEAAEKLTDVARRDMELTFAVTGASKDIPLERVLSVIDKISDENVRGPLTNWLYFFKSQALNRDRKFDEARALAGKVIELDQRVYLFSQIAEALIKNEEDQTKIREMLEEIATAASKAPNTVVTARALLALANLYTRVDGNRSIEVLGNAVRVINAIDKPDFSQQFVMMKIEGKNFGSYASFQTPGFNPETAFAEIGKFDFDGTLSQSTSFAEKTLRSLTTMAVVEPCLKVEPPSKKRKMD